MRTQNLLFLNQYLSDFHCTLSFRRCLRSHFLFREKIKSVFNEHQLFSLMPPAMRTKIVEHINRKSMNRLPLLCKLENTSKGAFSVILPKLNPYCFRTGDVVLHPMLGTQREMFFVHDGEVAASSWTPLGAKIKSKERLSQARASGGYKSRRRKKNSKKSSNSILDRMKEKNSQESCEEAGAGAGGGGSIEGGIVDGSIISEKLKSTEIIENTLEKKFYGVGSYFGECLILIPDERSFQLEVEVVATRLAEVFGFTRPQFLELQKHYPELGHQLQKSLKGGFENSIDKWVDITPAMRSQELIHEIWPDTIVDLDDDWQ